MGLSSCKLSVCCSHALERRSKIISSPMNFTHVVHMGPDQDTKVLTELPVVRLMSHSFFAVEDLI